MSFKIGSIATGVNHDIRRLIELASKNPGTDYTGTFAMSRAEVEWLLTYGNEVNRTMRNVRMAAYTRAMDGGYWKRTHQGGALDVKEDGTFTIIDAQNRFTAYLDSKMKELVMDMTVGVGLGAKISDATDGGIVRSMRVRKGMGPVKKGDPKSNVLVHESYTGAFYQFVFGTTVPVVVADEHRAMYAIARRSIEFAVDSFGGLRHTSLTQAGPAGTFALAHYFYPREVELMAKKLIEAHGGGGGLRDGDPLKTLHQQQANLKTKKEKNAQGEPKPTISVTTGTTDRIPVLNKVLSIIYCSLQNIPTTKVTVRKEAIQHFRDLIEKDPKLGKMVREHKAMLPRLDALIQQFGAPQGGLQGLKNIKARNARLDHFAAVHANPKLVMDAAPL